MAINIENLIDLSLLQQYDKNLKEWAEQRFSVEAGSTKNLKFTTNSSLPQQGELNTLYVTEDSILVWESNKYIKLNDNISWNSF